ncbi:MAG: hypothetical protein ABH873_05860 [Candidatus Firestonebacteria bacterium]
MKTAISITLPSELVSKLEKIKKEEMTTVSGIVMEALKEYIEWKRFKQIQKELSLAAKAKGILTEEDVERIIHEARKDEKN